MGFFAINLFGARGRCRWSTVDPLHASSHLWCRTRMKRSSFSCWALWLAYLLGNNAICQVFGQPVHINAGSDSPYTDSKGNVWEPDTAYVNTGYVFEVDVPIKSTKKDPLYQSERYDPFDPSEMMYSINLDSGIYEIWLYFAEIFDRAFFDGARVFSVRMEGKVVVKNLDIYQAAGAGNKAHVEKVRSIAVNDGVLNIDFVRGTQSPKVLYE